eukprot:Em0019g664a
MDTPAGLDQRIDFVTNETLAATRRIRGVAEETNQVGVDTLVALNEQGEKLDNAERRLDEMNVDLKQTDKHLNELEKCCCCISCSCFRSTGTGTKAYKKGYGKKARAEEDAMLNQPTGSVGSSGGSRRPDGPIINKVTNDAREDEMEDNLQAVSDVLTNLKGIATEMGSELDRQNNQIDRLGNKMDANQGHLDRARQRVNKQL